MTYPPEAYRVVDDAVSITMIRSNPFGHLFTCQGGLRATRIPLVADVEDTRVVRLRGHLNAQNPQTLGLDGTRALAVFSGPSAYVSPHWRVDKTKGGTYDYEEVQVFGSIRVVQDSSFFARLVNDLSSLIEPANVDSGDYPVWNSSMAPPGHIDRQSRFVCSFEMSVESVSAVSKLHQDFPLEDRVSIANHLARSRKDESRAIARKIHEEVATATLAPEDEFGEPPAP